MLKEGLKGRRSSREGLEGEVRRRLQRGLEGGLQIFLLKGTFQIRPLNPL